MEGNTGNEAMEDANQKHKKNSNTPEEKIDKPAIKVERWGWYSIGVNIALILINGLVARSSGSLAVGAELLHNAVDLLTAIAVLIGLNMANRKTMQFPYGLYKLENVIAVGLAGMTFLTGYEIAREALLATPHPPVVNAWSLIGITAAWILPYVFSTFELRAGQAANSPALIADAKEYRAHVFTTGMVFAALAAQWFNLPLDRIAALVIVVAIAKTGWELLADGMRVLLDASLDADTLLQIREIISATPSVIEVKWITGRNAGRFRFVEAEVVLRTKDLKRAESTTQRVEKNIRDAVPHVERVLIHASPQERSHKRYAVALSDPNGTISLHFGEAPYFALLTVQLSDKHIEEQQIIANPYTAVEKAKGIRVAEWLVTQKVDEIFLKETLEGKGPVYAFGEAGVAMQQITGENLAEIIAAI